MSCEACKVGTDFDVAITMAFQPIANLQNETVYAYEALVRGQDGSGAGAILAQVSDDNRYAFDQRCRTTAIELAARLNLASSGANLSINFLPNAVYEPRACIRATLASALRTGFPLEQIIFEFTEGEALDTDHILQILRSYRDMGFKTAIDDFGSGFAGLGLLSKFQPDIVKIDMQLIRGIDTDQTKRTIIKHTISMMHDLDIQVICEGVETVSEHDALRDLGVTLMQGYLFAKPVIEELPSVSWVRPMLDPAQVA